MTAIRELLHWLVDHAEARDEDRAAAHQLVDEAHPADPAPDAPVSAPERGPEPGEGGGQA